MIIRPGARPQQQASYAITHCKTQRKHLIDNSLIIESLVGDIHIDVLLLTLCLPGEKY